MYKYIIEMPRTRRNSRRRHRTIRKCGGKGTASRKRNNRKAMRGSLSLARMRIAHKKKLNSPVEKFGFEHTTSSNERYNKNLESSKPKLISLTKSGLAGRVVEYPSPNESIRTDSGFVNYPDQPSKSNSKSKRTFGLNTKKFLP